MYFCYCSKVAVINASSSKKEEIDNDNLDVSEWEELQRAIQVGEEIEEDSSDEHEEDQIDEDHGFGNNKEGRFSLSYQL